MDVSICITTYRHEKYIEECILSVFAQQFSGDFEIIIGDDNSTEETEKIIQKIAKNHPYGKKIRYFKNNPNLGYVKNTLFTFSKAKGKYISVLDGDDYFIDPLKIQKQFNYLEQNDGFSAATGDSLVIYEDADIASHSFSNHREKVLMREDLTDLKIAQTSTLFFRKNILRDDFPTDIISADRCLYLLSGCFGKMKVLPDPLSSYRQFQESISKKVSYEVMKKDFAIIPFIKKYEPKYSIFKLKAYFFYTLMSYSNAISKKQFLKASLGYTFYHIVSKFTFHPLKLYSLIKWTKHTVLQKYEIKKQNHNFV